MASKKFKIGQSVVLKKNIVIQQHPDSYLSASIQDKDRFNKLLCEKTQVKFAAYPAGYYSPQYEKLSAGIAGVVLGYEGVYFLQYERVRLADYQNLSSKEKLNCFKFSYVSNYHYRNKEKNFYVVLMDGKKIAFTTPSLLESVDDAIDRHKHVDVVFSCVMRINNANKIDVANKIKKRLSSLNTIVDSTYVASISTIERDGSTGLMSIDDEFNVSYTKQITEASAENEMQSESSDEKA